MQNMGEGGDMSSLMEQLGGAENLAEQMEEFQKEAAEGSEDDDFSHGAPAFPNFFNNIFGGGANKGDSKNGAKNNSKKEKSKMTVFDILEPIVAALLVITIVFTLFFRIVNVSGRSMMPTLNNGDKIVISATGYEPQRGDVVVLSGAAGIKETIVKRIIAINNISFLHLVFINIYTFN